MKNVLIYLLKNKAITISLLLIVASFFLLTRDIKLSFNISSTDNYSFSVGFITPYGASARPQLTNHIINNKSPSVIISQFDKSIKRIFMISKLAENTVLVDNITLSIFPFINYTIQNPEFTTNRLTKPNKGAALEIIFDAGKIEKQNDATMFLVNNPNELYISSKMPKSPLIIFTVISTIFFLSLTIILFIVFKKYLFTAYKLLKKVLLSETFFVILSPLSYLLMRLITHITTASNNLTASQIFKLFILSTKDDIFILCLLFILSLSILFFKNRAVKVFLSIITFFIFFILSTDIALMHLLNARLILNDAVAWGGNFALILTMTTAYILEQSAGKVAILSMLLFIWLSAIKVISGKDSYTFKRKRYLIIISISITFSIILSLIPYRFQSYSDHMVKSILTINNDNSYKNKFTKTADKLTTKCVDGLGKRQNIILIVVESLSSYKSAVLTGDRNQNDMPYLDNLMRENYYINNFYSNGYSTRLGMFNLLSGNVLIHNGSGGYLDVNTPKFYDNSAIRNFNNAGYNTIFITPVDINLDGKTEFTTHAGFKEIYSQSDPFFQGKDIYVFNAVSDNILFERSRQIIQNQQNKPNPFLLFIETVTTHGPYIDPISNTLSYEKTLQFSDKTVKEFIDNLKADRSLQDTIIIITSDHRVMMPTFQKEFSLFGDMAYNRIPFIMIENDRNHTINNSGDYSLTDVGGSIEYLMLDKACFNEFQRNIFDETDNRSKIVLNQKFFPKSMLDVKYGERFATICLDGDNTRLCSGELPDDILKKVINYINFMSSN